MEKKKVVAGKQKKEFHRIRIHPKVFVAAQGLAELAGKSTQQIVHEALCKAFGVKLLKFRVKRTS